MTTNSKTDDTKDKGKGKGRRKLWSPELKVKITRAYMAYSKTEGHVDSYHETLEFLPTKSALWRWAFAERNPTADRLDARQFERLFGSIVRRGKTP
jgi:hypothetical protein